MPENDEQDQPPPDYAADRFLGLRQQLAGDMGLSEQEVIQQLADLWVSTRRRRQQPDDGDQRVPQQDQPEPAPPPLEKRKLP
jgi:hypothetical protein